MQSSKNNGKAPPQTVDKALDEARELLNNRLEADLLASHALNCERSWLYAHGDDPLDYSILETLRRLVARRLAGHPIAQLCGSREFYGRTFGVDEHVLIPRPETELLIDLALTLPLPATACVCDIGTGSGCVALTLAAERPGWNVAGIDCSHDALTVAAGNRDRLRLDHVELLSGDLFAPVKDRRFDLVVSNPPYVADNDPHIEHGDLRFEPHRALAAGGDGLEIIHRLVPEAFDQLEPGGWLLIEHGHDQAARVRSLFEQAGFAQVDSRRDLAAIERATLGLKS